MILSGNEIEKEREFGNITIKPFYKEQLNPNSYNYRIGNVYRLANDDKLYKIPDSGLLLQPNKLYLCSTYENIGSDKYVISLIGRSSVGRLGLFVQCHSDMGNLGTSHNWTLEISCVQPIIIYPRMVIGQISFWETTGKIDRLYTNRYTEFNTPKESIY